MFFAQKWIKYQDVRKTFRFVGTIQKESPEITSVDEDVSDMLTYVHDIIAAESSQVKTAVSRDRIVKRGELQQRAQAWFLLDCKDSVGRTFCI